MATMYDVPLHSIDDTYEIVDDKGDGDDYPFLGERHEHIVDNWLVVDSEDHIIDVRPRPPPRPHADDHQPTSARRSLASSAWSSAGLLGLSLVR
jgi:hypothetical protein